jgi:hypothetical protein
MSDQQPAPAAESPKPQPLTIDPVLSQLLADLTSAHRPELISVANANLSNYLVTNGA